MTHLITPFVTISYPNLFVARARKDNPTGPKKFSASFLFTQAAFDDPITSAIRQACSGVAVEKWGKATYERMLAEETFVSPFRKDCMSKGYPEQFVRYISSSSGEGYPPAVVDRAGKPITDQGALYAGCVVRVSLSPRAYGGPGTPYKPGIMLDLRNVQKVDDGERLAGGGSNTGGTEFDALTPAPVADALAGMLD